MSLHKVFDRFVLPAFLVLLLASALFLSSTVTTLAAEIVLFESDIEIRDDGSVVVTENITYDFKAQEQHGIFRVIPFSHPQDATAWYKERYIELELRHVLKDGELVPFEIHEEANNIFLKIGDPNKRITGPHTYSISYLVQGGLLYGENNLTEIYWNVTGNDWKVPMRRVVTTVRTDGAVALTEERACYTGRVGEQQSCETIASTTSVVFAARHLAPEAGMTIAHAIDSSTIDRVILERAPDWLLIGGIAITWVVFLWVWITKYVYQHRRTSVVVAQYEPYKDFKPMMTGVLADGQLHPEDITAGLLNLAEEGFIRIKKTERKILFWTTDDHDVVLQKSIAEAERAFDKTLLGLIFEESASVGTAVSLSELSKNTAKVRENIKSLNMLRSDATTLLYEAGYYETRPIATMVLAVCAVLLSAVGIFFLPVFTPDYLKVVPFMLLSAGIAILATYRRRTAAGFEAFNHLEGFEEYLSVTGKDRFEFHNSPEKSPTEFLKHLPYAIALGVEKEWAEVFADVTVPAPDWYEGTEGGLNATSLAASMGSFSTSFGSSSGSTGGSASSGGGSVGGGAGGGGGGSW